MTSTIANSQTETESHSRKNKGHRHVVLHLPLNHPDLNPIELLWATVKNKLSKKLKIKWQKKQQIIVMKWKSSNRRFATLCNSLPAWLSVTSSRLQHRAWIPNVYLSVTSINCYIIPSEATSI